MNTLKPWLDLCRVSNLPTVWTNVLAAGLLATGQFQPGPYLLLALALSCFYLAGMSFNDLCDLEHDRRHRPGRPLPSGRVSVGGARALTLALFAAGWVSMVLPALLVALVLGIQPAIAHDTAGRPLFFPFGPEVVLPAVLLPHALVGLGEGLLTLLGHRYLTRRRAQPATADAGAAATLR